MNHDGSYYSLSSSVDVLAAFTPLLHGFLKALNGALCRACDRALYLDRRASEKETKRSYLRSMLSPRGAERQGVFGGLLLLTFAQI